MEQLNNPEKITLEIANLQEPEQAEIDYSPTDGDLEDIKVAQSGDPSYVPKKFKDQFYFKNDGSLFVNINNVWRSIGSKVDFGSGTSGSGGSTTSVNCGFRPKAVMVKAKFQNTNSGTISDGICDENGTSVIYQYWYTVPATPRLDGYYSTSNSRVIYLPDSTTSNYTFGQCSITSTGFDLYWESVAAGAAFYQYIAIG